MVRRIVLLGLLVPLACALLPAVAQEMQPPLPPPASGAAAEPVVERLDEERVQVGSIVVDQAAGEMTVPGRVNPVTVLEYVATSTQGVKSYESALDLDATALEFNLALILLGLDAERGVPSERKFDPRAPEGDAVEIWVEWLGSEGRMSVRAEELVFDSAESETLAPGPWVYTGSVFGPNGEYLAEILDVLIGFMHTPESIIDSPRPLESPYGAYQLRTDLGFDPGAPVRVVIRPIVEEGPQ